MTSVPLPTFRASQSMPCGSDYVCDGIEIGDRVAYVQLDGRDLVVLVCEPCADRTEASAALAACDPIEVGGPPQPPQTVAEALERLREHHANHGHYDDELVDALLPLLGQAAENVARVERERWAFALHRMARGSSALDSPTRAGLRIAASLIERNRENLA
jgi:hypothetical protein